MTWRMYETRGLQIAPLISTEPRRRFPNHSKGNSWESCSWPFALCSGFSCHFPLFNNYGRTQTQPQSSMLGGRLFVFFPLDSRKAEQRSYGEERDINSLQLSITGSPHPDRTLKPGIYTLMN